MGEDCTQCREDFRKLQCCKGCNNDACFEMARTNCKTAYSACLKCPGRYARFATVHCIACPRDPDKPLTRTDIELDNNMAMNDHCCEDNHAAGCLCCPCFLSGAILGCVGMLLTWFGSTACCMAGVCCSVCKLCKKDTNRVSSI